MNDYGYGLWPLVVIDSLVFTVFAASFFHLKTKRDRIGGRRGTVSTPSGGRTTTKAASIGGAGA